ncbi:MAG: PD40 domain-containing protein [Solirubrobacterales bacterium]|nr:PD40 domain-containing protein [Solirubrobacterales bacterium]
MSGRNAGNLKRLLLSIVAVLALGFVAASGASASLAVGPGSTFSTSYINLPDGALPGGDSGYFDSSVDRSSLSANGRYLAFTSEINSMSDDANPDYTNVYRKDRQTGAVELVSRAGGANGAAPAAHSFEPRISADGNTVAFLTKAAMDPADTDGGELDVYVRNLSANTTFLATPGNANSISSYDLSSNGLYVAFVTDQGLFPGDTNMENDVYRRNLLTGVVDLVSRKALSPNPGPGFSRSPSISGDGKWVAFESNDANLVIGFTNGNAGSADVFVRNMDTDNNYLVSTKSGGGATDGGNGESYSPSIAGSPVNTADVRVSYDSNATDISGDDMAPAASIYQGRATIFNSILISRATGVAGVNANSRANGSEMSDDGNLVFFSTDATNLDPAPDYYGAYVRDISGATTNLRSNDNEYAIAADISADGSRVAWTENGGFTPDSDPNTLGVFTRPTGGGTAEFTSRQPGNAPSLAPGAAYVFPNEPGTTVISADGRYVAFAGVSTRLPAGGQRAQAYRRDLSTGEIELASRATGAGGTPSEFGAEGVSISADGSRVGFVSFSSLDPADVDTENDIYMRDFSNNTTTLASRADGPGGAVANQDANNPMISGDGKRIVFHTDATNMGVAGGDTQVFVRDFASNKTILVSRDASADPGVAGDNSSEQGRISGDGQKVVFESRAANLDPADALMNRDIYVRDLAGNKTTLVSRLGGLAGAVTPGFKYSPAISADGKVVAFETDEQPIAPEAGAWPPGTTQVVSRVLATGANALVSRAPGGAPAEYSARRASIDGDGSVIAFNSDASNLKPGLGGVDHEGVFARQSANGAISGPPMFGQPDNGQGTSTSSISENGQCLAFNATGYNDASGDLSDLFGTYVNVVSGTCLDPRKDEAVVPPAASKPKLSKVKLTNKKFRVAKKKTAKVAKSKKKKRTPKGTRIKFNVDVNASVTIKFQKKTKGRKYKGKCRKATRKNKRKKKCKRYVTAGKLKRKGLEAGAQRVYFSGRIGKKKLKPGKYRALLTAYNNVGASKTVRRGFKVVRR